MIGLKLYAHFVAYDRAGLVEAIRGIDCLQISLSMVSRIASDHVLMTSISMVRSIVLHADDCDDVLLNLGSAIATRWSLHSLILHDREVMQAPGRVIHYLAERLRSEGILFLVENSNNAGISLAFRAMRTFPFLRLCYDITHDCAASANEVVSLASGGVCALLHVHGRSPVGRTHMGLTGQECIAAARVASMVSCPVIVECRASLPYAVQAMECIKTHIASPPSIAKPLASGCGEA